MSEVTHYITNTDLINRIELQCDITVATLAERDALLSWRRKWKMIVGVFNDGVNNGFYSLDYNKTSTDLSDNGNWTSLNVSEQEQADYEQYDNTATDFIKNKPVLATTIAALNAYDKDQVDVVFILDSGLNGFFQHIASSSETNDGIMFLVDASSRVYERIDKTIYPRYFGAVGDGTTNDLAAFNALFAYVTTQKIILEDRKDYRINGTLVIEEDNVNAQRLFIDGYGAKITTTNTDAVPVLEIRQSRNLTLNGLFVDGSIAVNGMWYGTFNDVRGGIITFNGTDQVTIDEIYWSSFNGCRFRAIKIYTGTHGGDLNEFNVINFSSCQVFGDSDDYAIEIYGTANMQCVKFDSCDLSYQSVAKLYIDNTINDGSIVFDSCYLDDNKGFPLDTKNLSLQFVNCLYPQDQLPIEQQPNEASRTTLDTLSVLQGLGSRRPSSAMNLIKNGDLSNGLNDITISADLTAALEAGDGYFGNYIKINNKVGVGDFPTANFTSIPLPFDGWYNLVVVARNNTANVVQNEAESTVTIAGLNKRYNVVRFPALGDWAVSSWQVKLVQGETFTLKWVLQQDVLREIDIAYIGFTYGKNGMLGVPLHPTARTFSAGTFWGNDAVTRQPATEVSIDSLPFFDSVTSEPSSADEWSNTNEHGATYVDGVLKLFPANFAGGSVWHKGLVDDGLQEFSGEKRFVSGLFAVNRTTYNDSVNAQSVIGSINGDAVDNDKIYRYRWLVTGNAASGQGLKLQYKKYNSGGGETWVDTGVAYTSTEIFTVQLLRTRTISPETTLTYNIGSATLLYNGMFSNKFLVPDAGEYITGYSGATPTWIKKISGDNLIEFKGGNEVNSTEKTPDGAFVARRKLTAQEDNDEYTINLLKDAMCVLDVDLADITTDLIVTITMPPHTTSGTVSHLQINVTSSSAKMSEGVTWKYGSGIYNVVSSSWKDDTPLSTIEKDKRYNLTIRCFGRNMYDMAIDYFSRTLEVGDVENPGFDV